MSPIMVIKVSGAELDNPTFLSELCTSLAAFEHQLVLVHGGGKEITAAMEHFGQSVQFIDGLRVTPPESMAVMEMVVSGRINKRLVAHLVTAGRKAIGLSGVDLGLLRCVPHRPKGIDLGRVGSITSVDAQGLHAILALGWLPVLAPVALGEDDGLSYNVNADHVAQSVAIALSDKQYASLPAELIFISNVPGVSIHGVFVEKLTAQEVEESIQAEVIIGGMIPKVRSALAALEAGVASVRITSLPCLAIGGTHIESS